MTQLVFNQLNAEQLSALLGYQDKNLECLEKEIGTEVSFRQDTCFISTEDEEKTKQVKDVLEALIKLVLEQWKIDERTVIYACHLAKKNQPIDLHELYSRSIGKTLQGKTIYPKTMGQKMFAQSMEKKDIVFAIGPAGTGKTYLAVVYAVSCLKKGDVKRIVLTRPAVEAGESLGFLPGDLKEKVDPYLRPLYDALHDMLGAEQTEKYIEKGIIEIAPLAYMRGRTLEDAFIILDEAQNTTASQMKMFLTRMGFRSKMVINGDITQIDLPSKQTSGLSEAVGLLSQVEEIGILHLNRDDVVRHPLVQKIIQCYEEKE